MTVPTYPRIDPEYPRHVFLSDDECIVCINGPEAQLALRALQDAFAAGQRSMIQAHGDRLERAIEALKPAVGDNP